MLRKIVTAVLFLTAQAALCAAHCRPGDGMTVMFWNLENMFDCRDGGGGNSDAEFTPSGERRWTKRRFSAKCSGIAKTVYWVADRCGTLPDVIGVAEVENRYVVDCIVENTVLHRADYGVVHFESPDTRGIDVALLYRKSVFDMVSAKPCRIYDAGGRMIKTRDILCVCLRRKEDGKQVYFTVNHHPSKFGGAAASHGRREAAMKRLKEVCDSLDECSGGGAEIISMGDFNDTPDNPLFGIFGDSAKNLALGPYTKGEGTIRFAGKWDLIDMFIVSASVADEYVQEILYPPFLMTRDTVHGGEKPLRTYSGLKYTGGISDHCPVIMRKK